MRVAIFVGTRPEGIKMAPVVHALRAMHGTEVVLCTTGQHREMLSLALQDFGLEADHALDVMTVDQQLAGLTSRLLCECDRFLESLKPDWVLVQGDTTTVFSAALAAFYRGIKIGHVEAGLRSGHKRSPFPEELNRSMVGKLADLHFCPTLNARENLISEGVDEKSVFVTGNTVIDALLWTKNTFDKSKSRLPRELHDVVFGDNLIILVTCHRRENFGRSLECIMAAVKELAEIYPEYRFVFPVHLNPRVSQVVHQLLGDVHNVILCSPLSYRPFVELMSNSSLVLTDSGGLQEEAPALNKPVIVLRDVTERNEGILSGVARLAGTKTESIVAAVRALLDDPEDYARMANAQNPYGAGDAAKQIAELLNSA